MELSVVLTTGTPPRPGGRTLPCGRVTCGLDTAPLPQGLTLMCAGPGLLLGDSIPRPGQDLPNRPREMVQGPAWGSGGAGFPLQGGRGRSHFRTGCEEWA